MQNKGFVKFLAIALTLICIFYLSFSAVTSYVDNKASEMEEKEAELYLDSLNSNPFYLGLYNLKQCRETAIGLGLDLKGGMNVILEVSVPDVVKALADYSTDTLFVQSLNEAQKQANESQGDFISLFVKTYRKNAPNANLAQLFSTSKLKGKINPNSSDSQIEKVLHKEIDEAVDNSFVVLRARIDRFGVVQPNIQKVEGQSGRIMVELPGIKEPERVRKLLQGSASLEFWETYDNDAVLPYLSQLNSALRDGKVVEETAEATEDTTAVEVAEASEVVEDTTATEEKKEENILAQVTSGDQPKAGNKLTDEKELEKAKAENPLFSILQVINGRAGCAVGYALASDTAEINRLVTGEISKQILPTDLSLKWGVKAEDKAGKVFTLYAIRETGQSGRAPIEGDVVTEAKDAFDQNNRPCVTMKMNTEGARKWAALTERSINHCVAIVLDGVVYSAPNVKNKIDGGSTEITGNFTASDTKDLANVLQSGKMPAPIQIVQEDIVGPSLGQESINAGFISFIIAFVILMVYMCVMYGFRAGMVANSALLLNFFFTLGILTSLQAALTMSGIAGMVLTLGMAVDANVLIYERTKEELKAGKNLKNAVSAGYSNAFSAIFDSNLTSIITGAILFYFGTGPIKGFATTLIIGIICSFFTAVWLTHICYEHFFKNDKWLDLTFSTSFSNAIFRKTNFNFMGYYKKSFTVFGIIIAVSIVSLGIRGLSQSIDFTGGRNYKVEFAKEVVPEDVARVLSENLQEKAESDDNISNKVTTQVIAIGTDNKMVRISTNYRINDSGQEVDAEIEEVIYRTLVDNGMIDKSVSLEQFIDRENREGGSIISSQKVGPSIAEDITYGAIWSVILALIAIFLYILVRFRNVAFSIGSVVALAVDTILILGVYSLCYGWIGFSLEIDQTFIGAILTVIGYSINDKVVIFDRIREEIGLYPNRDRQTLFNYSLNATLTRTINTSCSTLIVLLCIFFFGGDSIRSFSFAMSLGVIFGTCSSLFIAAPIAYIVLGRKIKEHNAAEAAETVATNK